MLAHSRVPGSNDFRQLGPSTWDLVSRLLAWTKSDRGTSHLLDRVSDECLEDACSSKNTQ